MKPPLEDTLFTLALRKPEAERAAFLERECGDNTALRRRIDELLAAHESQDAFLEPQTAPTDTATVLLPPEEGPGTLIGRYKILEKVGEGGFGAVYVAEQREPVKRRVALKIIKLGMDTRQVVARFEAERQALALMDHPNIAKVHDAGATETGRPYFVMELVKGIPITKFCEQEKTGTTEKLKLFVQVCHAIQHAHQKGIIHRDIKPSNILVTLHDGAPVPKVIDFGIAKATQAELTEKTVYTQFQQFIGTPAYMSPEQAEMSGLDIDTRSDIYSLGVLLYELLTGSTPFDTKELLQSGLDEMRKIIREREPVRPSTRLRQTAALRVSSTQLSTLKSALSTDLDWIVMKCLEKDRRRRYETANAVAMDIERHLNHEPVVARPPSVGYRVQKSFRRHSLVFTATGAVGLALVLGVVVSAWQAVRATKAGRREAQAHLRADQAARVADAEKDRAEREARRARASELEARENLYAADMNLAYQAWQDNNLGLALELLNKHRPTPPEPDLRGWEWRYLWSLCQSDALYTFGQHSNYAEGVFSLAMSPDNKLLATACAGGEVGIWDVASRRLIEKPETNYSLGSVAFSPDGKVLAFATGKLATRKQGGKQGVTLWDVQEHREITNFPGERQGGFGTPGLGFSPSGCQLAIGAMNGPVVLWDLATRTAALTLKGHSEQIDSLAFSRDGHTLVTGSGDNTVRVWSLPNGQEIAAFTNRTGSVQCVALSPDGKTVAAGSWDKTIRIWDLVQRSQVGFLTNHTRWVAALAFSPDGKTLASASADCLIKLWDTGNWREVGTRKGSQDEVYGLVFSSDGKTLFSGTKGGKVLVWDGRPQGPETRVLRRPDDAQAFWLSWSGIPFCWHSNKLFNLWEPLTLRKLAEHPEPGPGLLGDAVWIKCSPTGDRLAIATRPGLLYLWDVEQERQIACLPGWPSDQTKVGFSPNGKLLAAVAPGKGLKFWNLEKLELVATLLKSAAGGFREPVFAADSKAIAIGNNDGTVEVWNLLRKVCVGNWKAHTGPVSGVAFMPDGKQLVTVSLDCTARLWEVETQHPMQSFGRARNAFYSVAVSPDGQRIAAGAWEQGIKIWNPVTGQEVATLKGINDWADPNLPNRWDVVTTLTFLPPDGNTLISGTPVEARLWRAPSWAEIDAAEAKHREEATTRQ